VKNGIGAFEIKLGDLLVFSKLEARRFPKSSEVLKGLEDARPK
jgi:selT/selW/selH-like putative selenoprotein